MSHAIDLDKYRRLSVEVLIKQSQHPFRELRSRTALYYDDELEISAYAMAKELDCSASTIANWEENKTHPNLDPIKMLQLCNILEITLEQLAFACEKTLPDVEAWRAQRKKPSRAPLEAVAA